MNKNSIVHVAVGVLLNENREVLIALRSAHSHQGGLWEFPGGKVEEGESVEHALNREFEEELGISVQACTPLIQIRHEYSDKLVMLDVWRVERFSGIPKGKEGQAIEWRPISKLRAVDFPKANEAIIRALNLPD
ncbi:MAG: 8-oxo-dGTP diphosphatase MutT [SAR86 cluster bacterium]|uniref:8-oxo-dGTP diphosphatase n=1 Tax=SAR86 cluster bacterium TaxID=2030880 RepID=A0A2A4XIG8_9GAMM|nr:MAG: 8-oxo-dGTP diphosphatase MutT [SAR86 cluster bacterium]